MSGRPATHKVYVNKKMLFSTFRPTFKSEKRTEQNNFPTFFHLSIRGPILIVISEAGFVRNSFCNLFGLPRELHREFVGFSREFPNFGGEFRCEFRCEFRREFPVNFA